MLPEIVKLKKFLPSIRQLSLLWIMLLFVLPVYAQTSDLPEVNAQSMLVNFATTAPNLMRLVTSVAYVLGMFFMIAAIIKLKHMGEMRTMMSQEHSPKGPLLLLMVGAMLIYLPTTVQVGMSTFWTNPNPWAYNIESSQWMEFFNTIVIIMQLIGVIAFIRGLIIMSHLGQGGGHQGGFAKGITHIIAGVLLINLFQFMQFVFSILGLGSILS